MPTSRSPSRDRRAKLGKVPADAPPAYWPWVLIGAVTVLAVVVAVLPASMMVRLFPRYIQAEEFSGSVWHGSSGKLSINGRDAGAFEWRIDPKSLLRLRLAAELHWVKGGFVLDGVAQFDRGNFRVHDIHGGGPIEDLHDLGVAAGVRGLAQIQFKELAGEYARLSRALGVIEVSNLASAQIAGGANLGSYEFRLADTAVGPDGSVTADMNDTGGPLQVEAHLRISPAEHTSLLTGTMKERSDMPAELRAQVDNLAKLQRRDAQGRIPVDLELTFGAVTP